MTTLATGLNAVNQPCVAACQGSIYYTNNYDQVKKWNGIATSLLDAGISSPPLVIGAPTTAAGGFSNGDHLIRYRYKDSSTGYVSNPSPALTVTVSGGNGLLTFGIGAADDIRTTSDTKVDQYIIEATPVGGGTFYEVGAAAVGATSVVVGMADTSLIQQFNSDSEYGSTVDLETFSNEVPPLGTIALSYRGRLWIFGDEPYSLTSVTFTNGSTSVTGTGFSTAWDNGVPFLIVPEGSSKAYQISAVASSTALTLSTAFTGTNGAVNARVVKRFPNRGYYSRLFYPEQFFTSKWARDFLANKSDQVKAVAGRKDGMYIFGLTNSERLVFNSDPSAAAGSVLSSIQGRRGCFNQRCLIDIEGELFSWDRQGMWIVNESPTHISLNIDPTLLSYIDFTQSSQFHACFDPSSRTAFFFFVRVGDTSPKMCACYEIETGRWSFNTFLQGITASQIISTESGDVLLMLGDENGYSWYYGFESAFDGTPPLSPSVVTVTEVVSSTEFYVAETLPTTGLMLDGVMFYNPLNGESRHIESNTDGSITIGTPFTINPSDNQKMYIGPILFEYQSKWWVGSGQDTRKTPPYLVIKLLPGSTTGEMRVYFYADFNTQPSQVTAFIDDDLPDGVTAANGDYYLTISLSGSGVTSESDGVLSVPVPIEWKHAIRFKLTSSKPDGDLKVLDAYFATTDNAEKTDVGN
jgi:hypothetical protein